ALLPRRLAVLPLLVEVLIEELAVASDRDALPAVHLRGGGADAVWQVLAFGRSGGRLRELQLLDLAGEDFDLALDLRAPRRIGRRGAGLLELRARLGQELLESFDSLFESLLRLIRARGRGGERSEESENDRENAGGKLQAVIPPLDETSIPATRASRRRRTSRP